MHLPPTREYLPKEITVRPLYNASQIALDDRTVRDDLDVHFVPKDGVRCSNDGHLVLSALKRANRTSKHDKSQCIPSR